MRESYQRFIGGHRWRAGWRFGLCARRATVVDADTRIAEGALATAAPDLVDLLGRPATSLHDAVAFAL